MSGSLSADLGPLLPSAPFQLYGPAGSGKTTITSQLALFARFLGYKVLHIADGAMVISCSCAAIPLTVSPPPSSWTAKELLDKDSHEHLIDSFKGALGLTDLKSKTFSANLAEIMEHLRQ